MAGQGRAQAGQTALGPAAGGWTNPAALGWRETASAMTAGMHIIDATVKPLDQGSRVGGLRPVSDPQGDALPTVFVPHATLAVPVTERLGLGLQVSAPFGLKVRYDHGWFGRYDSIRTDLTTIAVSPSFGWQAAPWLTLGAGIIVETADATLSQAIPNPILRAAFLPSTDGRLTLKGDDVSIGAQFGLQIELAAWRFGLHYRLPVSHRLEGSAETAGLPFPLAALNGTIDAAAVLKLPGVLTAGFAYAVSPRLTILGDVQHFGWSRFRDLTVTLADGRPSSRLVQNYRNTVAVSLGAEWRAIDVLTLRAGLRFDPTPTRDAFRSTRIPDEDRLVLAIGGTWAIGESLAIDFAYNRLVIDTAAINVRQDFFSGTPLALSTTTALESKAKASVFTLGARLAF